MLQRTTRYGLFNSLGVIVDDAIVVAILFFGGILDACPNLKVCIAHGGGPACFAMGDWPFVPWHPSPIAWVQGLKSLTQDEKDKLLLRAAPSSR